LKENSASNWFSLYGYVTMHDQQNIKNKNFYICLFTAQRVLGISRKREIKLSTSKYG